MIKKVLEEKLISLAKVFAIGFAALLLTTCGENAGLGSSVDTEAPKLGITYPPDSAVIRGSFVLAGTCEDDKTIKSVSVVFRDTNASVGDALYFGPYSAEVTNSKSWKITLNDYNETKYSSYNGWQFPDGTYTAEVTVVDDAGHSTGPYSRSFSIDNTAPVFVITSPGETYTSGKFKKYGSSFTVSGTIAESHKVAMSVKVFGETDDVSAATPLEFSESEVDTSGSSSVEFARYNKNASSSNTKNNNYINIYGETIDTSSGIKNFKTSVILTDNAKQYINPSENSNTTIGNSTSKLFLYDDVYQIYQSATSGYGLYVSDMMNILNGTKTGTVNDGAVSGDCETIRSALREAFVDSSSDLLAFSLNPNAGPTYSISGYSVDSLSTDSFTGKASKNSTFTVIATAGENETNINPSSIKVWIRDLGDATTVSSLTSTAISEYIATLENEVANGTAVSNGASAVAGWTLVSSNEGTDDSSDKNYTYSAKLTSSVQAADYYIIVATGCDADNSYFKQDDLYGFLGELSGNPPELEFSGVMDQDYYADSDSITFTVKTTSDDIALANTKAEVTVKNEVSGDKFTNTYTVSHDTSTVSKTSDGYVDSWTFKLSDVGSYSDIKLSSGDEKSYLYTIKFTATNTNGGTYSETFNLHVDAIKPVVTITAVNPYADGEDYTSISGVDEDSTYLNGKIKVQGNVTESNLSDVSYEVYVDGSKVGETVSLGQVTQFSPQIDTTSYTDGKEIKIIVTATDSVGNKGTNDTSQYNSAAYIIKQATDTPQISLTNADSSGTDAGDILSSNVFTDATSNTITGTVTDDDGIAKLVATLYDESGNTVETKTIYEVSSNYRTSCKIKYELPQDDDDSSKAKQGIFGVKFEVYDSEGNALGNASTGIFYVGVDTENPIVTAAASAEITKESFSFSGTAGDVNGIKSLQIIDTSNNNKAYTVGISSFTKGNLSNSWTYDFVVGTSNSSAANYIADGKHTFQVKATDTTGETNTVTKTVTVDTTAPKFSEDSTATAQTTSSTDANGVSWYKSSSLAIKGTATDGDEGTGISTVKYLVSTSTTAPSADDENWAELAGTTTFTGTVENIVSDSSYIYIMLTDQAGNTTIGKVGTWKIDTVSPELTEGSVEVGGKEVSESSPYYSNGTADAEITFSVSDPTGGSGIKDVYVLPYSQISADTEIEANKATLSSGAASFTISGSTFTKSGTVYARIYDYAGNYADVSLFALTFDNTIPKSNNPAVADASSYTAYKNGSETDGSPIYYVNNQNGSFTFSGIATDNLGVASVKLTVSDGTNTVEKTTTDSEWTIENVSLASLTGSTATATITITDLAGNIAEHSASNPTTISLKFDTTGPVGSHTEDAKGKDVYFRLGENDNDDIDENSTSPAWDNDLDTDVGGKYKSGTYGNANTIKIRGLFNDSSSGVSMIYYKVSQATFTSSEITSFKSNYANEKTGYFAPLSSSETRRVFYSVAHNGTDDLGGTKFKEGTNYDTYYKTFESTYDTTISGFQVGANYLMLVAVDNVGNAAIDTVQTFQINVDTTVPEASADSSETILTNGKKADDSVEADATVVTISGSATDSDAGLRSIYFTAGGKTISSSETTYGTIETVETDDNNWTWTLNLKKALFTTVTSTNISISTIVTDSAGSGNSQSYAVGNITVDVTPPTLTLNTPTDALKSTSVVDVNKTISLSGNAKDGNTLDDNAFSGLQYKKSSDSDWTDVSTALMSNYQVSGSYSFSVTGFDTTKFSDEMSYDIRAVAVDKAGNTGYSDSVTVYVNQKSDRPILNFTNLTTNASDEYILKLNDAGTVEGTVSDDDSTSSAVVKSLVVTELASESATSGTDTTVEVSSSGDFTFSSSSTDDGAKYFKFTVVDNDDTTFTSASATSDYTTIPVLSVKAVSLDDSTTASSSFTYKSDNESPVVDNISAVSYASSGDESVSSDGISASFVVGGTERQTVALTIHASDANGIAGMLATIIKTDGTTLKYKTTSEATIAGKTVAAGYTNAGTFTGTSASGDSTWVLPSLSVAEVESGSVKIAVTPYDNSGLSGNGTFTFTVDNDGPSVTVTSPKSYATDSSTQNNGSVTLAGTVSDSNDVASVSWFIPTTAQQSNWASLEKESLAWNDESETVNFTFSGDNLLDNYANSTYTSITGTYSDPDSTYYVIPIYFRAVDELGNIAYSTDYKILYNPDVDKISTTITNPGNKDALGGTVRMIGSTSISSYASVSLNSVYIQLGASSSFSDSDKTKAGTGSGNYGYTVVSAYDVINEIAQTSYTSSTMTDALAKKYGFASKTALDSWWGVKTTTNAWKLNLNENKELDPSGDSVNTVYLRASAVNSNGKFGDWTDSIYVTINNKAPNLSETLYQFSTAPTSSNLSSITSSSNVLGEKSYYSGIYIKGQWYLEVTATQASDQSYVLVESVTKDNATLTEGTDYFTTATSGDDTSIKIYIPIDKDATDTVVYKVTAMSKDELFSAASTYSINVDNTAPTIGELYSDYDNKNAISMTKIENSNYKYDIYSKTVEEGSGLGFMAVYFMRNGKVELPLPSITSTSSSETKITAGTGYTGTLTQVTSDEAGEVLYGVSGTVTSETSGETTVITSSDLITEANAFIRTGSLVKLSGTYYPITAVDTTAHTVTVATTFGTAPTTAFFPAAIAVNTSGEGASTSTGITTISKDDGDGFMEAFDASGTNYAWQLEFFSDELDDGQIDIVVVAADIAGNYSTDTTTVMLTNHKPRVSKVFLATDLNGDEVYTEDEFAYTATNNGVEYEAYAYSALDDSGNEQISSTLSTGTISIRDGMAVTFEMLGASNGNAARTGGGTALYYIPKILTEASTSPATGSTTSQITDMSGSSSGKINVTVDSDKVASTTGLVLTNSQITSTSGWASSMENGSSLTTQSVVQLTIWDNVNNTTTIGTDDTKSGDTITEFGNQYTIVNIPVYFDMTDDVAPVSEVTPFYWTKEKSSGGSPYSDNNSLYFYVKEGTSGDYDDYVTDEDDNKTYYKYTPMGHIELGTTPSVSGVIKVEGTVSDDQRLTKIAVTYGGTAVGTITYDASEHTWAGDGAITSGYVLSAVDTEFGQSGHKANWTLLLDTAKYGNAATKAIVATATQAKNGTTTTNADTYTVKAVPYITGLSRPSGTNTYHSSTGRTSVIQGETLTVTGFNFGTSGSWKIGTAGSGTYSGITNSSPTAPASFTLTAPANSGALTVTSTTSSENNTNSTSDYNTEVRTSGEDESTFRDDKYVYVWNVNHTVSGSGAVSLMPTLDFDASGRIYTAWSQTGKSTIELSKDLNASNRIFVCYDQPTAYSALAVEKSTGNMGVTMFPDHLGNGGQFSDRWALANGNNCGGAGFIAVNNNSYLGVNEANTSGSQSNTGRSPLIGINATAITANVLNPNIYLDNNVDSPYYQVGTHEFARNLGSFSAPQTARYGNYGHSLYYDETTGALKYTVVTLPTAANDTTNNDGAYNGGRMFDTVVIDGPSAPYDRQHETAKGTAPNGYCGFATATNAAPAAGNAGYYKYDYVRLEPAGKTTTSCSVTFPTTVWKTLIDANGAGLAFLTDDRYDSFPTRDATGVEWSSDNLTATFTFNELPDTSYTYITVYAGHKTNVTGVGGRYASAAAAGYVKAAGSAGDYSSIDITSTGCPVIMYKAGSSIRLAYTTSKTPAYSDWTVMDTGLSGGLYVSMKIDTANNDKLHAVYKNGSKLMYVSAARNTTTGAYEFGTPEVIDTNGSLTMSTLSLYGNSPVVTYLNSESSEDGVKYAKQVTLADDTTVWDYSVIPAVVSNGTEYYVSPNNYRVYVGANAGSWSATQDSVSMANCEAFVGFKTSRVDVVFLKNESASN